MISAYEFDNSPQDIALLRNISGVSAACHMPFIGAVGPKFFLKDNMEDVAAIKISTTILNVLNTSSGKHFVIVMIPAISG
jgi:predicted component of type VI protein secretion system